MLLKQRNKWLSIIQFVDLDSRFVPAMVAGDRVGAIAMTEPGAGSDLQGVTTRAKLNANGDYILNGSKVIAFLALA